MIKVIVFVWMLLISSLNVGVNKGVVPICHSNANGAFLSALVILMRETTFNSKKTQETACSVHILSTLPRQTFLCC